jgi:hypothetical protein
LRKGASVKNSTYCFYEAGVYIGIGFEVNIRIFGARIAWPADGPIVRQRALKELMD